MTRLDAAAPAAESGIPIEQLPNWSVCGADRWPCRVDAEAQTRASIASATSNCSITSSFIASNA